MLKFIKNKRIKKFARIGVLERPGFVPDPRNYSIEELMPRAVPVSWVEKSRDDFRHFLNGKYTQDGSGSCVAWSFALCGANNEQKENGIFRMMSPRSCYAPMAALGQVGVNGGISVEGGAKFYKDNGMVLEILLPSNGLGEQDMRKTTDYDVGLKQIAKIYKPSSYFYVGNSINEIANILSQGYLVSVAIMCDANFYPDSNGFSHIPGIHLPSEYWYHEITFTDFGLVNGKKTLSWEHAWGAFGYKGLGYAFMGEEWFGAFPNSQKYIYGGPLMFPDLPDNWRDGQMDSIEKPVYIFNKDLAKGDKNEDVRMLQLCFKYLGAFPASIEPTGYFGGLTFRSAQTFQCMYSITETGYIGSQTRAMLNKLFSNA